MGVFVCDICSCIENTALGFYWGRRCNPDSYIWFSDPNLHGKDLCSECMPLTFADGSKCGTGKWHGKFDKEKWTGQRLVVNRIGVKCNDESSSK